MRGTGPPSAEGNVANPSPHPKSSGGPDVLRASSENLDVALQGKLDARRAREPFKPKAPEGTGPAMMPFRGAGSHSGTDRPPEQLDGAMTAEVPAVVNAPPGSGPDSHRMQDEEPIFDAETSPGFANLE